MQGLELAARFSYITNALRFCGPKEAKEGFLRYFAKEKNDKEVEDALQRFEGLLPYLNAIAKKHQKGIFDKDVVEAYWIGNTLLDNFQKDELKDIINALSKRGLPKSIAEDLKKDIPKGLVPHHNFNVMYVGVGKTTSSVPTTLQNMDNCRISWGRVIEAGDNLLVRTRPLIQADGKFSLGEEGVKTIVYLKEMLPDLKKNENVALHWGFACMTLTDEEQKNLEFYTNKIIESLNQVPPDRA